MTRIIIFLTVLTLWILFLSTAHAATGHYTACAGTQCTEFDAEFYTAEQIKEMRPQYFCVTYLEAPPMVRGELTLHKAYMLVPDCKKRNNMAENDTYDYINPRLEN